MNVFLYGIGIFGYSVGTNKTSLSFVFDEKKADIELFDVPYNINSHNIIKYLRHHIMQTDDEFQLDNFVNPIFIKFRYRNEVYQICLTGISSKKTDHYVSPKEPKILSAILKHSDDDEGTSITEQLVEFHGPNRNFFNHIPDAISDISILLRHYGGNTLHTFDMLGNKKIYKL